MVNAVTPAVAAGVALKSGTVSTKSPAGSAVQPGGEANRLSKLRLASRARTDVVV